MSAIRFLRHCFQSLTGPRRKAASSRVKLEVQALEARTLLDAGLAGNLINGTPIASPVTLATQQFAVDPIVDPTNLTPIDAPVTGFPHQVDNQTVISAVPQLSSLPGARATLYLNFTGDTRPLWSALPSNDYTRTGIAYSYNVQTYPYDTDGNPDDFSDQEQSEITEIWARVAEAYAPFNLNVTTVNPGNLDHGRTLMVNIGASNGWYGNGGFTGTSSTGSFIDGSVPNVVFVFTENCKTAAARENSDFVTVVANTVSHEAGHGFGLAHHSTFDPYNEYDPGSGGKTPIMGDNATPNRHTWGVGMTTGWVLGDTAAPGGDLRHAEWDIGIIASDANGFGLRPDDYGDDFATATPLNFSFAGISHTQGVIGIHPADADNPFGTADVDVFSFTTDDGPVTIRADVLPYAKGANLMARVELWSSQGMIAAAGPDANLNAVLNVNSLAAGSYYVKVMSAGDLSDIGQYTLTVTRPETLTPNPDVGVHRPPGQVPGFAGNVVPTPAPQPGAGIAPHLIKKGNRSVLTLVDTASGRVLVNRAFRGLVSWSWVDLNGDGQLDIFVLVKKGRRTQRFGFSGIDGLTSFQCKKPSGSCQVSAKTPDCLGKGATAGLGCYRAGLAPESNRVFSGSPVLSSSNSKGVFLCLPSAFFVNGCRP
jgi:hypothetical protein